MHLLSNALPLWEQLRRTLTKIRSENLRGVHGHDPAAPTRGAAECRRVRVFKSPSHDTALYDFLKVVERTCENPLIALLHRNTLDQLKSTTAIMKGIQKRFEKDIGTDDYVAFNRTLVEWTE